MKRIARSLVVMILGWQVRRLQKRNDFKVIAVVGSIGKTSTKFAIAKVLSAKHRVRFQEGNYNDLVTVPLIFFGAPTPSLLNPFAWLAVFLRNESIISKPYPFEVVVAEIGTDGPGQIAEFGRYMNCDITVVTAITPEHMEYFADIDHVAAEEFSVAEYSRELVVNTDFTDSKYLDVARPITTFGSDDAVHYRVAGINFGVPVTRFEVHNNGVTWLTAQMNAVSKSEIYSATAAAIVADKLGLTTTQIAKQILKLEPVSGRMQRLEGIRNSLILDETYNASPEAVKAALDSLYEMKAPQKIAVLGNMNELGKYSADAHTEIGKYCDPKQIDLLVTLGPDANEYLAPAAIEQGCLVRTFSDPFAAGEFVKDQIKSNAVVLVKGSQNNVYAEEVVKPLLKNQADVGRLVRQSPEWIKKKAKNFS